MGELNIHNLNDYISKYNLNVFVETGTGKGVGVSHALKYPFTQLYSIEYMKPLWEECVAKFNDCRLVLLNTNSVDGLRDIVLYLAPEDRVLFWLDAHFPGADFHFNGYDHLKENKKLHKPLEEEFNTIKGLRSIKNDVFIIDDLRIYEEGNYELGSWEHKNLYGEPNINFILDQVVDTHNVTRDYRHQGFLILTPK